MACSIGALLQAQFGGPAASSPRRTALPDAQQHFPGRNCGWRGVQRRRHCLPPLAALGPAAEALLCALQATHGLRSLQELAQSAGWAQQAGAALAAGAAALPLANLATALQPSCFDAACQQEKDTLLVASLAVPLLVLVASVAYLLRPPPQGSLEDGSLFEDDETGFYFQAPPGSAPERDRRGELAFRAVSYTPWPVEEGAEGERIRLDVGAVGARQPRTFVFSKVLPQPSQLVAVTLERPLGIEFEEDARRKRVVVCGFTPGGHAEQRMRQAKLNASAAAAAALEGDVLRACTCTNIVYPPQALAFGMQPPTRSIVVYGADGQTWPQVVAALKKGLVSDGTVTLVLERRLQVAAAGSGAAARGAAAAAGSGAAGAAGSGSGGGSGGSSGG